MVAINSAIEIDLKGQACSDSMGVRIYSGIGGQVDFIRGATMSEGGIPIIAMESVVRSKRTGEAKSSKIVPHLNRGAGVVTGEGDIYYVVTEYGIAQLWGKGVGDRATELINIAHPKFRPYLVKKCREFNYKINERKIDYDQEPIPR
jgi:acetyl-CoA hydrolase